jgi:proteasome lid subunit RPN8/RPN11
VQQLPPSTVQDILCYSEVEYPFEAYGVVVRSQNGDIALLPGEDNTQQNSYTMSAHLILKARRQGEIIAFYHSHPNGCASPSAADLATMTLDDRPSWPGVSWLILSVYGGRCVDIRSYVWNAELARFNQGKVKFDDSCTGGQT